MDFAWYRERACDGPLIGRAGPFGVDYERTWGYLVNEWELGETAAQQLELEWYDSEGHFRFLRLRVLAVDKYMAAVDEWLKAEAHWMRYQPKGFRTSWESYWESVWGAG